MLGMTASSGEYQSPAVRGAQLHDNDRALGSEYASLAYTMKAAANQATLQRSIQRGPSVSCNINVNQDKFEEWPGGFQITFTVSKWEAGGKRRLSAPPYVFMYARPSR